MLDGETVDALARWAIERARPLRIGVATSPADSAQVARLRHRAVVESGWDEGRLFPDGLERDEDDDAALHVAAWDGQRLVGTVRVVLPGAGRRLPTERAFDLVAEPQGRVADWGRLVVDPDYRDGGHAVMLAVLGRAWLESRAHGVVACVGVATRRILALYRDLGVEATVLGGPKRYWGEDRYAARLLGVSPDAERRMARTGPERDPAIHATVGS